jgi:hypothetical protein
VFVARAGTNGSHSLPERIVRLCQPLVAGAAASVKRGAGGEGVHGGLILDAREVGYRPDRDGSWATGWLGGRQSGYLIYHELASGGGTDVPMTKLTPR